MIRCYFKSDANQAKMIHGRAKPLKELLETCFDQQTERAVRKYPSPLQHFSVNLI